MVGPWIRGALLAATVAAGLVPLTSPSLAEAAGAKAAKKIAKRHAKRAKRLLAKKRFDDAGAAYEEAYDSLPLAKWRLAIAKCHAKAGNLPMAATEAHRALTEAEAKRVKKKAKRALAKYRKKLRRTHGEVRVTADPDGATALLQSEGSSQEGTTPWIAWVAAGTYELTVSAEGRADHWEQAELGAGEVWEVDISLEGAEATGATEDEEDQGEIDDSDVDAELAKALGARRRSVSDGGSVDILGPAGLATLGAGVLLLGAGGVFAILTLQATGDRDGLEGERVAVSKVDSAHQLATERADTANILLAAGAGAALLGGVLLLLDDDGGGRAVRPELLPTSTGWVVGITGAL
jgi:tetratricopeptide (TPR) repeat protein